MRLDSNNRLCQRETIDGKPHGGVFVGKHIVIKSNLHPFDETNPYVMECKSLLDPEKWTGIDHSLEKRHVQWILRPPLSSDYLNTRSTVVVKFLLWGRAFKVLRCFRKGAKRYKKVWLNGHRKRIRD